MDSAVGSRATLHRTPLRSRAGCNTCRSKKVKCDEQRSVCGRCRRLRLQCEWLETNTSAGSAKTKRYGGAPRPKAILPKSSQLSQPSPRQHSTEPDLFGSEAFDPLAVDGVASSSSTLDFSDVGDLSSVNTWDTYFDDLVFPAELTGIEDSYPQLVETAAVSKTPSTFEPSNLSMNGVTANMWLSKLTAPLKLLIPDLSAQQIALHPSFQITAQEHRAIQHYQTHFSWSRTSKTTSWSTHAVMLRLGSEKPMVMHLIIASSLLDLSLRADNDPALCQLAQRHFQVGAYLLIDTVNSSDEPDHVDVLTAFYLLYLYMSKRKDTNPQAISQLSKTVLNHVQRYDLDRYIAKDGNRSSPPIPRNKTEFLARLIIWLFYEDVATCFLGHGGTLASYLRSDTVRSSEIYEHSTTSLESCWGSQYPDIEAVDDVENSAVLRCVYDVISMFQDINQYCQSPSIEKSEALRRDLDALEEKSRAVFRLTKGKTVSRSRVVLNADWAVSLFYSLRIYHFRCTLTGLEDEDHPRPAQVEAALASLLIIAQRRISLDKQGLFERFQVPLFMAGIETNDAIHREWISNRLKLRYKNALEDVLRLQETTGRRVTMSVIRHIMNRAGAASSFVDARDQFSINDGLDSDTSGFLALGETLAVT